MTEKNKDRLVYSVTIPLLICLIPIFVAWKSTRSEEIQKLKENTEPKHIDFRHTPSTILDELLKIIQ